jgi:putative ABC transport system ATP-binding protein
VSGKTVYESQGQQYSLQARIAAQAVDVVKVYGSEETEVRALDRVSVDFPAGEFTGVMGSSGSGKSTLLHCLAALDQPTSGTVRIGETAVGDLNDRELTRLRRDRIGFVFQAFNLLPTLSALENIELPRRLAGERAERSWLDTVIDTLGLRDRLPHRPAELSGGQQQRVAVARALAGKPDIVFADEPTGNLDSRTGAELLNFMRRSVDELDQTIVMVTHDPGAAAYADRVVFLADGRVAGELREPTAESVLERIKGPGA